MPTTYKRLNAAATTTAGTNNAQTLYTNNGTTAIVSTIVVCNTSGAAAQYRICVNSGTSFAAAGYIAYDATVAANDTVYITAGITLDTTNKYLLVSASSTSVSFSAFGAEIS